MESMFQCWALAVQEFNFDIVYGKRALITNADALSRKEQSIMDITALTVTSIPVDQFKECQQSNPAITQLYKELMAGSHPLWVECGVTHPFIDTNSCGNSYA